jgi:hypothetical protein
LPSYGCWRWQLILRVVLWDSGWLTRQGALVHWLLVGVMPPALALWQLEARRSAA